MEQQNKKWFMLICGTLTLFFLGLIYGWSVFRAPLSQEFSDWTNSQMSMTFTISMSFFCIGGFIGGKLVKKYGFPPMLWLSAILLLSGFSGASTLGGFDSQTALMLLYLFYGVLCGTGSGISYNVIISHVVPWFSGNTGFASGTLMMGFGLGGAVLGTLVSISSEFIGVFRTFFVIGIIIALVLIIGSFLLNKKVPAAAQNISRHASSHDFSPSEMLKTPTFWLFLMWLISIVSGGLLAINNAVPIAASFALPATLGLIVTFVNGFGRVLWGVVSDKFGIVFATLFATICLFVSGCFLLSANLLNIPIFAILGLMTVGLAYSSGPALSSVVAKNVFGSTHYSINFSLVNFNVIPASLIGPLISSYFQDRYDGSFVPSFILLIVFAVVALVFKFLFDRSKKSI